MPEDILFGDGARLNVFLRRALSITFLILMVRRNFKRIKMRAPRFFFIEFICDFANEERLMMETKWCDANINLIKLMPSKKTRESADCVITFIPPACTVVLIFCRHFLCSVNRTGH